MTDETKYAKAAPFMRNMVLAPNGNLDLRNAEPVVLTKGKRLEINARVEEIIQKPVEDVTDEGRSRRNAEVEYRPPRAKTSVREIQRRHNPKKSS